MRSNSDDIIASRSSTTTTTKKHKDISVNINCVENWIFSRYDIKVYVDGKHLDTLPHGGEDTYTVSLSNGVHTFRFENDDDRTVYGEVKILVDSSNKLEFELYCFFDKVTVDIIKGNKYTGSSTTTSTTTTTKATTTTQGNSENFNPDESITMPNSAFDYIESEWTIDSLIKHFEELGFTNIKTYPCDPDDDKYKKNIFEIYIKTGWLTSEPWEKGEAFDADAEIKIYYNEYPLLTVDNCPDLVTVLTSETMSYTAFCNKYDGRYVEFDAYVVEHLTYDGGTSHIIEVAGENHNGLVIRIGDRTWGNNINKSVKVGDHVRVSGRIDASWAKYFKCLYVETLDLSRR